METRKTRLDASRLKRIFNKKGDQKQEPLPNHLSHKPSAYENYSFENGRILLNGMDLLSIVDGEKVDVELLACLAGAIEEYRAVVWDRYGTKFKGFNGHVQAILEKILNKMHLAYEQMSGGLRVHWQGGRLWINDIDPKVVLALYLSNPTEERRRYLFSIYTKLGLILEGKACKSLSLGALEEAKRLHVQIRKAMENSASSHSTPLLAVISNLDR